MRRVKRQNAPAVMAAAALLVVACGDRSPADSAVAQTADASETSEVGGPAITYLSEPDPPRAGDNAVSVQVRDEHGTPASDLAVTATYYMPAMPSMNMPEMRDSFPLASAGGGRYTGNVRLSMGGTWAVTVVAKRGEESVARKQLTIQAKE